MRIAVNGWFYDATTTGSGQYIRRLVAALVAVEPSLRVDILLPRPLGPRPPARGKPVRPPAPQAVACGAGAGPRVCDQIKLHVHRRQRSNLSKAVWEQVVVPHLASQLKPDLLHIPYWAPSVMCPVPMAVTIHDVIPLLLPCYRGNLLARLYTAMVSAASARADVVLTDSNASRADILSRLRLRRHVVHTVPLAVDEGFMPVARPSDEAVRHRLGCPPIYLLYLGGFDVRKNLDVVFRAFKTVCGAISNVGLVVAGRLPPTDTSFTPDPRRLARQAGVPDEAVTYAGFVDEADKPALMRGAQALVFPSSYEGFGYPPLEALACGTPVVGSHCGSLPEVVGSAGILLSPHDAEGMAGALIQIITDDAFRRELQVSAANQAARFSWESTARATIAAYRTCLPAEGAPD